MWATKRDDSDMFTWIDKTWFLMYAYHFMQIDHVVKLTHGGHWWNGRQFGVLKYFPFIMYDQSYPRNVKRWHCIREKNDDYSSDRIPGRNQIATSNMPTMI